MWTNRPHSGDVLRSVFIDLREMMTELPPELYRTDLLASYIAHQLEALGYPLAIPAHCHVDIRYPRQDHYRAEVERVAHQGDRHRDELYCIMLNGLGKTQYCGEELIVSLHTHDCAVVSFV